MKHFILFFIFVSLFFVPLDLYAKKDLSNANQALSTVSKKTGIVQEDISSMAGTVLNAAFGLIGLLFFGLMLYAGLLWMTARGDEGQATKAKNMVVAATIGLIIMVASYAISSLVITRILEGKKSGPVDGVDFTTSPTGCCVDWVQGEAMFASPACRITTEADCKLQGEMVGNGDQHACPGPQEGCWTFDPDILDVDSCVAKCS